MSDLSSQRVTRHQKQGRSAVTNGKRTLIGVRGASKFGRRYRDLIDLFSAEVAEVGGVLTETEAAMIKTAAALAIKGEQMQAAIINGDAINADDLIRLSSEVRRILAEIAGKAGKRKPTGPTLSQYLAEHEAEQP
ncbi:hypothetical protein [Bradyrhizobium sp.]|jgi:hypothetical protein|uniref:hypothetical protein n=1 Tax=Bradyrhizobium sp. TaxID=376 RepID=UPI002D7EC8C6|nr:hypothetical protein [Bradyrhizobium sp.]